MHDSVHFCYPQNGPDYTVEEIAVTQKAEPAPISPVREWIGGGVFVIVLVALMFQAQLGLDAWLIALIGTVVIGFSGILNAKEMVQSMNLSIVLLYVATLGIGSALTETGAAQVIGDLLSTMITRADNNYLIAFILFFVPFALTQFMMNNAVNSIFVPLYIMLCQSMAVNPIGAIMLCNTATMTSFLTPLATPAIPILMGMGHYTQKDLLKMGWVPAVAITVTVVLTIGTLYPLM